MSVVTAYEDAGPCRKKLVIEIPAPAVEAETGRVVEEFSRSVRVPGFRPGKVPAAMVRKRYRQEIEKEVVDRLLPRYWKQAQAEKDIEPLIPPTVEDLQFKENEPILVTVTVETRPEIALGDYRNFDLPTDGGAPDEVEIDEALVQLRRSNGTWQVVDREAGQGDLVIGKVRTLSGHHHHGEEGGEHDHAPAEGEGEVRPLFFEIGGSGDEELSLVLTGARAGQTLRHQERHGDHSHELEITVNEIKEMILPALDDELARKLGDFDTVDELRQAVSSSMQNRRQSEQRRRRETLLLDQLRDRHPLALPEGVVRQETERMMQTFAEQVAEQGANLDHMDWGKVAEDMRPAAEKRVHARLLLDAVARAEMIRLDENTFEGFLAAAASQQKVSSLALRQRLAEDGRLEGIRGQMLRDQTMAYLLGEAPPVETEESQAEE